MKFISIVFCAAIFLISFSGQAYAQTQTPTLTSTFTPTETPTQTPWPYNPDLNGDQIVDATDLVLLMDAWHLPVIPTPTQQPTSTPSYAPTVTETATQTPTRTNTPTPSNTPLSLIGNWQGFARGYRNEINAVIALIVYDSSTAQISFNGLKTGFYTLIPPEVGGAFQFVTLSGANPVELNGQLNSLTHISGTYVLTGSVESTGTFTLDKQ